MRAAFSDPQGPWIWRAAPYALPVLLAALTFAIVAADASWWPFALATVLSLAVAGLLPTRQRTRRPAEITCGPGYVDVTGAGTRNQRIRAKSVEGATTARTARGFLLTLGHTERSAPLAIEVPTETAVEQIRHALGIGHGGFGTIGWRTVRGNAAKAGVAGKLLIFSCCLGVAIVATAASIETAVVAATLMGQLLVCGVALAFYGMTAKQQLPTVVMAADALRLWTPRGWFTLPYDQLLDVRVEGNKIVFVVPPPYHQIAVDRGRPWSGDGLSDEDAASMVAQIRSAAARARGLGPQKDDVTGRVEALRRKGESPRDWLVRLDMAGQMLATGNGYRGNTLDSEDLWAILEDPEADAELRAAAARVLRHSSEPEVRVRIDAVVAAVRDESTNKKLRIAVRDDLEEASHDLAVLDAQERPRRAAWPQGVRW